MDLRLCDRVEIELGIGLHAICGDDIVPFGRSVQEMAQMEDCRQPDEPQIENSPLRLGPGSRLRPPHSNSSQLQFVKANIPDSYDFTYRPLGPP